MEAKEMQSNQGREILDDIPALYQKAPSELIEIILALNAQNISWRRAYCAAEMESARLEAWASKLFKEKEEILKALDKLEDWIHEQYGKQQYR